MCVKRPVVYCTEKGVHTASNLDVHAGAISSRGVLLVSVSFFLFFKSLVFLSLFFLMRDHVEKAFQ